MNLSFLKNTMPGFKEYCVASLLLLAPAMSLACTCSRIASIEESIQTRPILVEAQVVAVEKLDMTGLPLEKSEREKVERLVLSVKLEVRRVLKGSINAQNIVVEHRGCYASLYLELMKVGHTYLLPLTNAMKSRYQLAGCAHSGMELIDGQLFTFEQTEGVSSADFSFMPTMETFCVILWVKAGHLTDEHLMNTLHFLRNGLLWAGVDVLSQRQTGLSANGSCVCHRSLCT